MNDLPLSSSREGGDDAPAGRGPLLPVEWLWRVKAATRDLKDRCGGLRRSAALCGFGKSSVERWCSSDHTDVIPLPAALLLEAECGAPMVTMAMAELHGRTLGPKGSDNGPGFRAAHIAVAKESAELAHTIAVAEDDGVITPNEMRAIEKEAQDLAHATARVLDRCAEAGGETVSVLPGGGVRAVRAVS